MSTRKIASVAFTGAAAVATVGFGTQAANAAPAPSWHITPGGHFTATNNGNPTLVDTTTGVTLTCTTAAASGSLSGNGQTATTAKLGTIANATFGTSSAPCSFLGINFTAKLKKAATLWGTGYNSTTGVTAGSLRDISASINGLNISCHATITGASLPGSFHNASNALVNDPGHAATLTVKSVQGCLGAMHSGDKAYFSAVYNPSPAQTVSYG